ncbi:Hpt domain-containing protein [Halopseudomonas pachastrellae]|nr:Hpt domain-containing protein [Halopseudomonas pachastrellae]
MPDTPQLQAQLAALEARFRQRLDDELDTLDDLSAQLQTDPSALQSLRDRLHKLAGSAGTFGYGELGSMARQLEQQAQARLGRRYP